MSRYRLTPAERRDPSLTWDVNAERCDVQQAGTYVREFQAAVDVIRILQQRMGPTRRPPPFMAR